MCNSTSTSSQWSAWPSVWPQTKEMWASIHFHVPLCLFCEIRLAFNRCYFSPVRFSLRPVWPEMNWPLLYVIDIGWLPRVTAARPPHQFLVDQTAWRIQTLFFFLLFTRRLRNMRNCNWKPDVTRVPTPETAPRGRWATKGTVWLYATH